MALHSAADPTMLIEAGRMLHEARIKQGLSMDEMCKKLGMRADQIKALEEGNAVFFQKQTQPLIWFARLYAKKLGVELPYQVLNRDQLNRIQANANAHNIPAFLMKKNDGSEK